MMKRMLGFFACAKTSVANDMAINASASGRINLDENFAGFIESRFGRYALSANWTFPIGPRLTRNKTKMIGT